MPNMIATVLWNVLSGPATRLSPRPPFESARGHLAIDIDDCIFCGLCQRRCPADAIQVERSVKSWTLNGFRCINCGECVGACPKKCLHLNNASRSSAASRKADSFNQVTAQPERPAEAPTPNEALRHGQSGGQSSNHA